MIVCLESALAICLESCVAVFLKCWVPLECFLKEQ